MPRVRIVTTEVTPFEINTNATTWGELRSELSESLHNINNMTVVLSTNKSTLDLDDAVLPTEENYKLYISPKAIKQGGGWNDEDDWDNEDDDDEDYSSGGINDLISIMKEEFVTAFNNIQARVQGLDIPQAGLSQEDMDDLAELARIRNSSSQ